jgi:TonB family protein
MQAARIRDRGGAFDELAVIAQRAQAFTNASGIAIALTEGSADELICRARAGPSAPEVGAALRVEGTFTGLCIQSGRELICDDAETDSRVDKTAMRALGIRSVVAIPIKAEGRVVGVLAAFAPTAHAFTITHVVVLKTLGAQIAAYLQRWQPDQAYSPEPLPAPPAKTAAASAAASPASPPAVLIQTASSPAPKPGVLIQPAPPASTPRQLPVVPKVEPVQARTFVEEIDPAPFSKQEKTNSHDEQKQSKTDFLSALGIMDAAAESENRRRANVLMIGAAAAVIIAVAVGLSFKLRRPAAAPQPALAASSSPGTPTAPASVSTDVEPPAKDTSPAPPTKDEEAQPKHEETVVLSAWPSRISRARDNSAPASDAPAISLGNVPASGSLSNLAGPVSPPPRPRLLTQSDLEPVTVIKRVRPVYPVIAKQNRLRGSVVVQGTVDKNGRIRDLQLMSGPPLFRDAAFAAVKQWVFKPARLNGQAIDQSTTIRVDFSAQ